MNNIQKQTMEILLAAIHGEKIQVYKGNNIPWHSILEEAEAHKVKELLYSAIIWDNSAKENIEKTTLEQWKRDTIFTGVRQSNHIKQIARVLEKFNHENIPVIVLKGLVVRELYPRPDLRTMSDADVLVHEENLNAVSELLISLGYKLKEGSDEHGAHIVFTSNEHFSIEVHWTIINEDYFIAGNSLKDTIWNDAINVKVGGVSTLSLSLEDLVLHLCVHMAVHIAVGGFGVRQLSDLVLLVEKQGDDIDWASVYEKAKQCKVEKFTMAIFSVCNRLFKLQVPVELEKYNLSESKYIDILIDDIFASGVYGRRYLSNSFGSGFAFEKGEGSSKGGVIKKYLALLFPPIEKMSDRYAYAKKNKILAPIAWVHHIWAGIFHKNYRFTEKFSFLTKGVSVGKKRNELLRWLEL